MKLSLYLNLRVLIISFICLIPASLVAQRSALSREVADRVLKVEENLQGSIVTEGDTPWSLKERIEYYKIPAVSIAVIKNYKIDWA